MIQVFIDVWSYNHSLLPKQKQKWLFSVSELAENIFVFSLVGGMLFMEWVFVKLSSVRIFDY